MKRLSIAVLILALAACSSEGPQDPVLTDISPSRARVQSSRSVTIIGEFSLAVDVSYGNEESTLRSTFRAWLGTTELQSVTYLDQFTLAAIVPGLDAGNYDLEVEDPRGRRATLPSAYRVSTDGDAGFPNNRRHRTDVDPSDVFDVNGPVDGLYNGAAPDLGATESP